MMVAKKSVKGMDFDQRNNNESCPRYVAYAHVDSYVEADDNLDTLLTLVLGDDQRPQDDVVIWSDLERVVAIITKEGRLFRIHSSEGEPNEMDGQRYYHRQRLLEERRRRQRRAESA